MDREYVPPAAWFDIFFGREQSILIDWKEADGSTPEAPRMIWGWIEYGCYVGIPLSILLFVAFLKTTFSPKRDAAKTTNLTLLICWFVFFILFIGDFAEINPYRIFKQLPIVGSLHVTGRFLIILMFISSLALMGLFQQLRIRYKSNRLFKYIILFGCFLIVGDVMWVGAKPFQETFTITPEVFNNVTKNVDLTDDPYQVIVDLPSYGSFSTMYAALNANLAILHGLTVQPQCYEAIHPRLGYELTRPLIFSLDPESTVSNIRFTPNQVSFDLNARNDSVVVLNQNFVRGWSFSEANTEVSSFRNKPSVTIKSGHYQDVSFYFQPNSLWLGLTLFAIGILVLINQIQSRKRQESS